MRPEQQNQCSIHEPDDDDEDENEETIIPDTENGSVFYRKRVGLMDYF